MACCPPCVPRVYGCVRVAYRGRELSVLAMERIPATYDDFVEELLRSPAAANARRTSIDLVAGFFALVGRAVRDLCFAVRDLHWRNLGVQKTEPVPTVCFLDFEACSYDPGSTENRRCRD